MTKVDSTLSIIICLLERYKSFLSEADTKILTKSHLTLTSIKMLELIWFTTHLLFGGRIPIGTNCDPLPIDLLQYSYWYQLWSSSHRLASLFLWNRFRARYFKKNEKKQARSFISYFAIDDDLFPLIPNFSSDFYYVDLQDITETQLDQYVSYIDLHIEIDVRTNSDFFFFFFWKWYPSFLFKRLPHFFFNNIVGCTCCTFFLLQICPCKFLFICFYMYLKIFRLWFIKFPVCSQ